MCRRLSDVPSDLREGNKDPVCALEEHSKLYLFLISMLRSEYAE